METFIITGILNKDQLKGRYYFCTFKTKETALGIGNKISFTINIGENIQDYIDISEFDKIKIRKSLI